MEETRHSASIYKVQTNRLHRRSGFVPLLANDGTIYRGLAQRNGLKPLRRGASSQRSSCWASAPEGKHL